jgi:hypothetical protein
VLRLVFDSGEAGDTSVQFAAVDDPRDLVGIVGAMPVQGSIVSDAESSPRTRPDQGLDV